MCGSSSLEHRCITANLFDQNLIHVASLCKSFMRDHLCVCVRVLHVAIVLPRKHMAEQGQKLGRLTLC